LRDENLDLAPFAVADGLLAKMTAASTWHLTEAEMDYLLGKARDAYALAKDCSREDAAAALAQAYEAGHATIQAGPSSPSSPPTAGSWPAWAAGVCAASATRT
jgi:hypothetical protein